jgi:hypothetical protein
MCQSLFLLASRFKFRNSNMQFPIGMTSRYREEALAETLLAVVTYMKVLYQGSLGRTQKTTTLLSKYCVYLGR